jgi:uncharacterized protein (DUF433 family)
MNNSISIDSQIRFGAPCVTGTRISVSDILGYIAGGDSIETITAHFPELSKDAIFAAISYASNLLNMSAKVPSSYEATIG